MESLELILFLLLAVVASSLLSQFMRGVSLPLVQILLGAVIAFAAQTPLSSGIDAELLLILFIAPLHFNESRHVDKGEMWRNRWGIASLVTGLVLVIMAVVGGTLHALIPAIPLAAAVAFAAAMGSTDAMAVTSLTKDVRFGKRHEALLAGEALLNDVMGTVGFQCAIAVVVSGAFSLAHAGEEFALELFGGFAAGAVLGFAAWALLGFVREHIIDNPTVHVVFEILIPFVIYLTCEHVGVGGIIPVVASGLVMSLMPQRRTAATAKLRLQSKSVWDTIEFVLNGVIFVVLGMQLPRVLTPALEESFIDPGYLVVCVLVLTTVLEGVRFCWILGLDMIEMRRRGRPVRVCFTRGNLKGTLAMAFAGPKGGVTLSLMLTMPSVVASGAAFPQRTELLFLASGVILCTLLLANFAVPRLVPHKDREKRNARYVDAEISLLKQVIESVRADAHLTGMVKGQRALDATGASADASAATAARANAATRAITDMPAGALEEDEGAPSEVDEPATVIVMKRYADRMMELAAHASPEVAKRARALSADIDELYDKVDAIAHALDELSDDDDESDEPDLAAHLNAVRAIAEAIDDVEDQALARELEYIKAMRRAGELSADHARALRNDVYIQQMTRD